MKNLNLRVSTGINRGKSFEIEVDGEKIIAYEGETVAAALLASGIRVFRKTKNNRNPRGLYCGIGQCQECRVTVNGVPDTLACQTPVAPGLKIETNR